jgi:GNAT superfamily N-acetyltransferase
MTHPPARGSLVFSLLLVLSLVASLGVALAGQPAAAAEPSQPLVGGYYYPWYETDRWTREPVTHTPTLGWYSSDDPEVATTHVRQAQEAGLDFFVVSWLSQDGREGRNFAKVVLPACERAGFRFALLYETPLALGLPAGKPIDLETMLPDGVKAGDRFIEHFDQIAAAYLAHPQYLRLGDRPVIVIYLVRDLVNAGPALATVRERLRRRGIEPHLVADAVYWADPERLDWKLLGDHFQAITAYNMYFRPDFLEAVRGQFAAADRAARGRGLRLVPSAMPGYDDTPLRGMERVTINRRRGQFYRDSWKVAAEFVGPDQPLLLVTSFNEWHEGTEIEPSTEFGDTYLKLTKELAAGLRDR